MENLEVESISSLAEKLSRYSGYIRKSKYTPVSFKKCKHCDEMFADGTAKRKYCSLACKKKAEQFRNFARIKAYSYRYRKLDSTKKREIEYRKKNRVHMLAKEQEWRDENRDRIREREREYRKKNRDKLNAKKRVQSRERNKDDAYREKKLKYYREWYKKNGRGSCTR